VAKISFEVGHILRNFYDKSHEKYLLMAVWNNINVYFGEDYIKFKNFWKNDRSATFWEDFIWYHIGDQVVHTSLYLFSMTFFT
jgi:hypothetical protein